MVMHNAVLLASENKKLQAVNEKQKIKRQAKRSYIANGGTLTVTEGAKLAQGAKESQNTVAIQGQGEVNKRAPPRCSLYNSLKHKANKCLRR